MAHEHHHAYGATGPGSVVLELGGDVGVLVISTPAARHGEEIEISPAAGGPRTHSMVRERTLGDRTTYAALYPGVAAGDYTVWDSPDAAAGTVTIRGGEVTTYDLS